MAVVCQPARERTEFFKEDASNETLRVVLLGKTGSGKSSVGNTLLGSEEFHVERGMCSGTDRCQFAHTHRAGQSLQVTDTPGVCDTHRSEGEVLREVGKSLVVASPGPHVILMVLRCDRRFTQEEYDAYLILKCLFGEEICDHVIVVFAGVDSLGSTEQEREARLQQEVERSPPLLKNVIADARGRYFGVDNVAPRANRNLQADRLLGRIKTLVSQNAGHHFSSQLYDDVNEHVRVIVEQRMRADDVTYDVALRTTKHDVIAERTSVGFFRKLVDIVGNRVLPALKNLLGEAVAFGTLAVATYCSLM
ncbi:GTPase IMAP family member 9-like [Babylonia areolata]|uniref:GTPase IMAP family member 9-like n=1 Tax=Babylonia areolata TaxID=304850 RepID=UPI003FD22E4F